MMLDPGIIHKPRWYEDDYCFKKSYSGMVLMIYKKINYNTGKWRKATEEESQEYKTKIDRLEYYKELIQVVKETHPEALI